MALVPHITVKGVAIHAEGDHPHAIIMVHGWPDTCRLWDATVEALKDRYCCVRFTLPGFDLAAAPRMTSLDDMCELLHTIVEQVSPGVPVTLLLHDWGCIFGYEYAARFPDRVARIIGVDIGDYQSAELLRTWRANHKAQVFGYQIWLALAWKLGGGPGNWMTRKMARWLRCRSDPERIGWQMNYPYAMRWFGSAGGLAHVAPVPSERPMLYIFGERKPFMFHSPQWLQALAQRPGCAFRAMPTGHWVMAQQAQAFNRCVREWLQASDASGPETR